ACATSLVRLSLAWSHWLSRPGEPLSINNLIVSYRRFYLPGTLSNGGVCIPCANVPNRLNRNRRVSCNKKNRPCANLKSGEIDCPPSASKLSLKLLRHAMP